MEAGRRFFYSILIVMFVLFVFNIMLAYAVDGLILGGVLKSIDYEGKTVTVDVKSAACPGLKRFAVDDISKITSSQIGKKFVFLIDNSSCRGNRTYKIMMRRGRGHGHEE